MILVIMILLMLKLILLIYDILNDTNKYVMNIISYELRYFKKNNNRRMNFYQSKEFEHIGKYSSDKTDVDSGNNNGDLSGSSLAIAIILSIVCIIIIAVVVIFIFKKKKNNDTSDEIEKLTSMV